MWLHPGIREPQWVQCFKLVIHELPNVQFRSVFVNPVTYNRLPFGVSSAPGVFQCTMESLSSGIPNVLVYLDDILVTGHDQEQRVSNLHEVLVHFRQAGLQLRNQFKVKSVDYLGYAIE